MIFFNKSLTHGRPLSLMKCTDNSTDDKKQQEKPRKIRKHEVKNRRKEKKKNKEKLKPCNKKY